MRENECVRERDRQRKKERKNERERERERKRNVVGIVRMPILCGIPKCLSSLLQI